MNATPPRIRLFAMDVDGTLTDGTITYTADGVELKSFHARDGAGIRLLAQVGIVPAIVSGRASAATRRRAAELGVETVEEGVSDKLAVLERLRREMGLAWEAVAFMGDDLTDIPPMQCAGYSAAPSDAAPQVRQVATFVCAQPGGRGAVREAIENLLQAEGVWQQVLDALGPGARRT